MNEPAFPSVVISSHVFYGDSVHDVHGPAQSVYDCLAGMGVSVTFFKHCIENRHPTVVIGTKSTKRIPLPRGFFQSFIAKFILTIRRVPDHTSVYIGVDPFNGLIGVFLKVLRRVRWVVYYTPDYTTRRYQSWILNAVYYLIDRVALTLSDDVWSVSSRISDVRATQGVPPGKNRLVPNAPPFSRMPKRAYDGNLILIIVANLTTSLNLEPVLDALSILKRNHPGIRLTILGDGNERKALELKTRAMKLSSIVTFAGQVPHDVMIDLVSRSFLGFALYTNASMGTFYGDSMKTREYVACGIPVITNTLPSTSVDVARYGAGLVMKEISASEIAAFVSKCIRRKPFYESLRKNALVMAETYDLEHILTEALNGKIPLNRIHSKGEKL